MSLSIKLSKALQFAAVLVCVVAVIGGSAATAQQTDFSVLHANEANGDYEPALLSIIEALQTGKLSTAVDLANRHLAEFPKSQVGHFLKADALTAMTGAMRALGGNSLIPESELKGLTHQINNRWLHASGRELDIHQKFPSSLLDIGSHPYIAVADMGAGRLYLYKNSNGKPELIRDYYMSVGSAGYGKNVEGDNKTPVGIYHINRYIEGRALPDLYGKGAFPVNYPNRYDRFLKRTGYGIWLHGTPSNTYARSPWASEGCFVLSNDDLLDIGQFVSADMRTPVILSDSIEWVTLAELDVRKRVLVDAISQWQKDWESLDTKAYVSHYREQGFNFNKGSYTAWKQRKKNVNKAKTFVQVDIELHSLFSYPGETDMFVVKFKQRYLSNNYAAESVKEQYWKRSKNGQWQIIYEG